MSTVGIRFFGYTPIRAVPPQLITAHNTFASGMLLVNPSTASAPDSSAIFTATGWIPPPVTDNTTFFSSVGTSVNPEPQPPRPRVTFTAW